MKTNVTEEVTLKSEKKRKAPQLSPKASAKAGVPRATTAPSVAAPASAPWHQRHRRTLLFGGGLAGVLILAFVISFVLLGLFDTEDDTAREALTNSASAVERTAADARRAEGAPLAYTALSEVADASADRATTVDETIADLMDKVDEERLIGPSVKALKAERGFLVSFSRISNFPESELGRRWRRLKPDLKAAQQRVDSSRQSVLSLNLGDTAHLMPANSNLTAAVNSADQIIIAANRTVQAWRDERQAAEELVAAAETYKNEMSSLMNSYYEQRNITQDLVRESHVLWFEAQEQLESQAGERAGIISGMESLSVPAGAESSHSQMVSLATQSKGLLEEAAARAAAPDEPIVWTGSPGWAHLSSESESITSQFGSAESAVLSSADQAIANEQAKLAQVGPRPKL